MLVSSTVKGCGWVNLVLQELVREVTGKNVTMRVLLIMQPWLIIQFRSVGCYYFAWFEVLAVL